MTMPTYPELRKRIGEFMLEKGEWAGCPIPIEGRRLVIEPSYPYQELASIVDPPVSDAEPSDLDANGLKPGERLVNFWYSRQKELYVHVVLNAEGRAMCFAYPKKRFVRRLDLILNSFEAAWAHDIETESVAMITLANLLTFEQMRQYMVLGQFAEASTRSKVMYIFRRARPTIAIRANDMGVRVLAVLCLHPIAYYAETFIGAMTPTDDVIAHLMLMRGDEHMFWKRSNQHQPDDAEAAI